MNENERRPTIGTLTPAVVRRLVLSILLIISSATAIATTVMSGRTFVALSFLGLAFFFYALHGGAASAKMRVPMFWLSLLCSIAAFVLMLFKFFA